MKELDKSKTEEALDALLENRLIRIGLIVAVSIGTLYIAGKLFSVVGNTINSFKEMRDSFRG